MPRPLTQLFARHAALALLVVAAAACRRSGFVSTPAGETAPLRDAPRVAYDENVTRANGWRPAEDSLARYASAHDYELARDGMRRLVARQGALRVLVYYNSTLDPLVSAVRRPASGVVEVDYTESGPKGTTTGRRTVRLVNEETTAPATSGRQSLDALLAHRLEAAVGQHLMDGNARVLDRALLVRQASRAGGGLAYSDAELRALADRVDLVLEVTFVPNPAARDGFELAVRGIRTRDAAVVVHATSAERTTTSAPRYAAVAGKGYELTTATRELSLRELCHDVMSDAMRQLAARF